MKIKETFLALIGISSERFEKLSEAEQDNLIKVSESLDAAETAQATAEENLSTSQARVTELEGELDTANETIESTQASLEEANSNLETANARIAELEGEVIELNAALEKKPAAAGTPVVKTGEKIPGEKTRSIRSWEIPLFNR